MRKVPGTCWLGSPFWQYWRTQGASCSGNNTATQYAMRTPAHAACWFVLLSAVCYNCPVVLPGWQGTGVCVWRLLFHLSRPECRVARRWCVRHPDGRVALCSCSWTPGRHPTARGWPRCVLLQATLFLLTRDTAVAMRIRGDCLRLGWSCFRKEFWVGSWVTGMLSIVD